jgi:hypothetical protein
MRNANPLLGLKITTAIVGFTMVMFPIIARLEGKRIDAYVFCSTLFLFCSLCIIHSVFKSIDKRLSDIEEKMNQNDR